MNIGRPNYVQISNVRLKLDYLKSWFYILNICNNLFELLYEFLQCGFSLSLLIQTLSDRDDMFLGCEIFGVFFSSRSLKKREKYISFAQFVYFLREVCLLFSFWMIKFTIMFFDGQLCFFDGQLCFFDIIVNFIIQKLKSKHTSLKKYANWAKLIYFSRFEGTRGENPLNISNLDELSWYAYVNYFSIRNSCHKEYKFDFFHHHGPFH